MQYQYNHDNSLQEKGIEILFLIFILNIASQPTMEYQYVCQLDE